MSSCREAAVDKMIKCRLTQNIGEQTRSWFLKTDKTPLNKLFAYQLYMGHAFEKQTRRRTNQYNINKSSGGSQNVQVRKQEI